MGKLLRKVTLILLIFCLLIGAAQAFNPPTVDQLITYQNTGNQRRDIVQIALSQVGYREKDRNDTFYGDWYQLPYEEWCAMFVSWCARQAEVSQDILTPTAWAHPSTFQIPCYPGTEYTPQPGDLFFTDNFTHVGIVWYVEGEFFYCIEGNARYHDYTLPPDPTIDSYHVMTNKRLIADHSFGVPDYEGCDKDHTYVRGHDSRHPHKAYYQCSTCGDKYYTGYTDIVTDCGSCFSCGCDADKAGYYTITTDVDVLRLRSGHSQTRQPYYVTPGSVVYAYGVSNGWAYIEFYGHRGHVPMEYLIPFHSEIPEAPAVIADKTDWYSNEAITLHWEAVDYAEQYRLELYRDGEFYQQLRFTDTSCAITLPGGRFEARLCACNRIGQSDATQVEFSVCDTYYVNYDLRGGTDGPAVQTQGLGQTLQLSTTEPTRQGFTFLGWTDDPEGSFVRYPAGGSMVITGDATLYAVWKDNSAEPTFLSIRQGMTKTEYFLNEPLDTTGLVLDILYSDGTGRSLEAGFTIDGFDPETTGQQTLTITCEGLTVTCPVQVTKLLPGDLTADRNINSLDGLLLMRHLNGWDVEIAAPDAMDVNGDGTVNSLDGLILMRYLNGWDITLE